MSTSALCYDWLDPDNPPMFMATDEQLREAMAKADRDGNHGHYAQLAGTLKQREAYRLMSQEKGTHVFAGEPDRRQSADVAHQVSRFRPTYRALTDWEKTLHDEIKAKAVELETLMGKIPPGRYVSLALTALEESVMWGVKGLTS